MQAVARLHSVLPFGHLVGDGLREAVALRRKVGSFVQRLSDRCDTGELVQVVEVAGQLRAAFAVEAVFALELLNLRHGKFGLHGFCPVAEQGGRLPRFGQAGAGCVVVNRDGYGDVLRQVFGQRFGHRNHVARVKGDDHGFAGSLMDAGGGGEAFGNHNAPRGIGRVADYGIAARFEAVFQKVLAAVRRNGLQVVQRAVAVDGDLQVEYALILALADAAQHGRIGNAFGGQIRMRQRGRRGVAPNPLRRFADAQVVFLLLPLRGFACRRRFGLTACLLFGRRRRIGHVGAVAVGACVVKQRCDGAGGVFDAFPHAACVAAAVAVGLLRPSVPHIKRFFAQLVFQRIGSIDPHVAVVRLDVA